jgi:hypothetical protein
MFELLSKKTLYIFLAFFALCNKSFGQNYGLKILASNFSKENNTALNLSPNNPICIEGNFEVSFEMSSLSPDNYFGYIFRVIEDNDRNFDLIYNAANLQSPFEIIVGDLQTKIRLNIAPENFLKQWNKITVKFDKDRDRLIVSDGHKTYVQESLGLKKESCYKLLFGANNDRKFKTNETLAIRFRNIQIKKDGFTMYHWPLDEQLGNIAHELIKNQNGSVKNPFWMASMHQKWEKASVFTVKGIASTAFDSKKESLFIIGEDSLFTFSFHNSVLSSQSNRERFITNAGSQSIYSSIDNNIYSFLPYLETVAKYSLASQKWDKTLPRWQPTSYWHANKVISQRDSSIYVFAGYGFFEYKNEINRFSLKTEKWEDIKPAGDFFTPRYLSALGSNERGDTIYVLGGYGNASGSQMVNPKNIYSMMRFTTRDKTFKKLYDLKNDAEDFAFASSLVIDASSKTYYGLVFPQRKYKSGLRLIVGSLKNSGYKQIGSIIPYNFHDVISFADLFYCPESKKFIAVTLLMLPDNRTQVSVYTLQGPPLDFISSTSPIKKNSLVIFIVVIVFVALLAVGIVYYLIKIVGTRSVKEEVEPVEENTVPILSTKNSIFLFGDLQIFDRGGTDITNLFTPLLKELFLLLLVNSVKNGRGLHAEKLDEILWFGKSEKSVRNNRSVNIAKLKSILEKIEHCQLLRDAGYWKIDLNYDFWYVDYHNYLNLIEAKKKLDEEEIKLLFELTRRGNFLSNHNYEWLDQFKAEISNEVIDVFLTYANSPKLHHPEFLIQIASFIFYFDPVSEEAMVIKCKALSSLGKHSLAKKVFDAFIKEYRSIYNEEFNKTFNQIV